MAFLKKAGNLWFIIAFVRWLQINLAFSWETILVSLRMLRNYYLVMLISLNLICEAVYVFC